MRLLLAVLLTLTVAPVAAEEQKLTAKEVVSLAITEAIRPGFAQYADETASLTIGVGSLCQSPLDAGLAAVQAQFKAAVVAWSRIELYRLGPLMTENRYDKILFWPDRKGIALKQVQGVLADWTPILPIRQSLRARASPCRGWARWSSCCSAPAPNS